MLESGVALSDAMDAIAEQEDNENFQEILEDVAHRIKSGEKFSTALLHYKRAFNSMFISMVKTSEASGNTARMLNVLSGYLTFEAETKKRIKRALTYPFVMAIVAVAATATLLFFVLPRFMKIYEARGASLPKITQLLVTFSQTLRDIDVMTVVLTTSVFVTMGLFYWTRTTAGRKVLDYFKISTPVISSMFIDTVITRSMRIMATMVSTGVNLLEAIEVMEGSCDNFYFQRLWRQVDQKIRNGYQLSEAIILSEGSELIDPGIIQMLKAGEKSGRLGEVCDKISVYYENKLHGSINNVTTLIEPLMITVLGIIIGTISIALLLPVFRISSVVAQ
jgi:type IV pilus assembly protein PilC